MEFVVEKEVGVGYRRRNLTLNGIPCRMVSTSRDTGICGDYVVKLDNHGRKHGKVGRQTEREIEFYNTLSDEEKELIPKILAHGELDGEAWLVQERVDFRTFSDWPYPEEIIKYKENHPELWDIGSHNFGIRPNGRPVIYDFAL